MSFLKVCKTEQTQKIARAIKMRKPGHRWCRDRVRIHPSGSPLRKIDDSRSPVLHIQACAEARMIRQWRERVELIPDLLFFAGVSVLGFTSIIGSAIFIDYVIRH